MPARSRFALTNGRIIPHLQASEFNALDVAHGAPAEWRRANLCPCRGQRSAAPNRDCARCRGFGWWWSDPVDVTIIETNDTTERMIRAWGTWQPGDISANMPTMVNGERALAGFNDRFYFPGRIERHYDRLTRGDTLASGATAERILSPVVSRMLSCSVIHADYAEGVDYELTPDEYGNGTIISWLPGGNQPAEGVEYSVSFEAACFYHVKDLKYRTEHGQRLPQAMRLEKKWTPRDLALIAQEAPTPPGEVA